jgi:putative phosphoesterase
MKICILSDSHDNRALLEQAAEDAVHRGAEAVLHCGDVVAPSTLGVLKRFELPVYVIHGNNTGDLFALSRMAHRPGSQLHYYGQDAGIDLSGRRIFLVHYPHYARAMATTGDWDLVCCGHDHVASIEHLPNIKGTTTVLVNPGTAGGVGAPATYVMGNLDTMEFEIVEFAAQAPNTFAAGA